MNKKYSRFLVVILGLSLFVSCKKTSIAPAPPTTPTPIVTADDRMKDTVLLYARDIYLWYNQIPSSFNPRSFANPDEIMKAIQQYSNEPGFTAPVDRWSFAMKQADWNNVSSGISGDFGLGIFFNTASDLRVKSVERESAAGRAGIRRGWQIIKINGSTNITTADADLNFIIDAVFNNAHSTFTFRKPDATTIDITLDASTYNKHPIMLDSVYTIAGKKIGYLVFNSFLGDQTEINNEFSRVFSRFSGYGIDDIIIDLRYNGGGYVSIAEKLGDYLAPSSTTGNVMMTQKYNDKYAAQYNVTTKFNKLGSVNLPRVFFIVSSSTASASELLINNLTPVMDVKMVGRNNTHGKPVGFFPIPVGDWYIFPVSFRTVNRNGDGNYFNGFTPNAIVADGLTKDWGDVTEASLASAIKYITTGAFRYQADAVLEEQPQVKSGNLILDKTSFKGTISNTRIFK